MRHMYLDKSVTKVKNVAQPLLDDHVVLISVHYAFLCSKKEIEQVAKAQVKLLKNIPQKVKKVLKSASDSNEQNQVDQLSWRSCAGQVIAVGKKVKRIYPGEWVACIARGDNYTDLICVSEHLIAKVTNKELLKAASIAPLAAIALAAVRRGRLSIGEHVCVIGLDIIGQLIVQLAKRAGCFVIAIDQEQSRLDLVNKHDTDAIYNITKDDTFPNIAYRTEHHGVDVAFLTDSVLGEIFYEEIITSIRKKGRLILVGQEEAVLSTNYLQEKEIDVLPAGLHGLGYNDQLYKEAYDYSYEHVRWTVQRNIETCIQLIENGDLSIDALVAKEITVKQIGNAYDDIYAKQACGVIFCYQQPRPEQLYKLQSQKEELLRKLNKGIRFIPATEDVIRVGVVGVGDFAKNKLMPILSSMKNVKINALVDIDSDQISQMSRLYNAKMYKYDDEMFADNSIDAVIIASPHALHAAQALNALQKGKAVLLEKPLATNMEQFEKIISFMQAFPTAPFCVDFNRSFAPFIQKIKRVVQARHTPVMINYRINAECVEYNHWVQTDVGSGRIIGEACQIIDLFCYLINAQPLAVSVEAMHAARDDIFPTDNFSVQIRFEDGSICSLLYTALGNDKLSKERMEVFFDSKAIVMEDYVTLNGFGLPSWFNEIVSTPNKGYKEVIQAFLQEIVNEKFNPPIDFARLETVTELTLIIDELACIGGGVKELKKEQG